MHYNKISSNKLKEGKRLFYNYPSYSFYFLPYLIDTDYYILSGPNLKCGLDVNCLVISNVKEEIETIISYQQDILGRNIGFDDKIFFLYNNQDDFNFFYDALKFPVNKRNVIKYFCSIDRVVFKTLLEKGISTLREAEYFYFIDDRLKKLLLSSNVSKKDFKLALNICFEITKLGLPLIDIDSKNVFDYLLKIRYPEFYKHKSSIDMVIKDISLNNVKIDFDRFFEGRKINIIAEIKTKEEFLRYLNTIVLNKDNILKIIDYLYNNK